MINKVTGVGAYSRPVNPELNIHFVRGGSTARAPFFGINVAPGEKAKAVQDGIPDGRSGWAISRERG